MSNKYDIALGVLFKARRRKLGITMQDVADHFGISKSLVCLYEQGKRSMNASLFFDLCDYYKLAPNSVADDVRKIADEV